MAKSWGEFRTWKTRLSARLRAGGDLPARGVLTEGIECAQDSAHILEGNRWLCQRFPGLYCSNLEMTGLTFDGSTSTPTNSVNDIIQKETDCAAGDLSVIPPRPLLVADETE